MNQENIVSRDNSPPLVSVITPVYNGAKYLEELIQSVLEQDYPHIEHITIDDGSTDDGATVEILKQYQHLRWWSQPNKGQYSTMNEGLAAAKGEFVTFINQDDKYAGPQAISSLVKVFLNDSRWDAVFGEMLHIDSEGRRCPLEGLRSAPMWLFRYTHAVSHASTLVRRKFLIERNLFFDESLSYASDSDWFNRLMQAHCRFRRIREPIFMFRWHSGQRTHEPLTAARIAEYDFLKEKYPYNPVLEFLVRRWISLIRAKNCFRRAGFIPLIREGGAWIKRHILHRK